MPAEMREKFLKSGAGPKNQGQTDKARHGSVVYSTLKLSPPDDGQFLWGGGLGWDDD